MSTDPPERDLHADAGQAPELHIDTSPWWDDPAAGYFGDDDDEIVYRRTEDGYSATFRIGPRMIVAPSLPDKQRPPPPGLSEESLARREMAERLTDDLVDPPYRLDGLGHDWAHAALEVPLSYGPVWLAYLESDAVIDAARRIVGEVTLSEGWDGTGLVFRVHGLAWSLILATNGPQTTVYLCRDDMPEVPLRVEPDNQQEQIRIVFWIAAALEAMVPVVFGGDYIPPEIAQRAGL